MKPRRISRQALASIGVIAIAWIALYARLVPELVFDWRDGGDFSHGFLVPIFAGLLAWNRREVLAAAPEATSWAGGGALVLGAVLVHLVGAAASELFLQRISMIPFLLGWVLLLEGPRRARLLLFPAAFLLFMIPPPTLFWMSISLPLQLLASRVAEGTLLLAGIDVLREGNILHLDACSLEVASACSGVRSLVTLLALAAILAEGSLAGLATPRSKVGKAALFLSAIPVAVLVNALRVTSAAFLASAAGKDAVDRFHDASGLVMFAAAFALLLAGKEVVRWIEERSLSRSALS